MSARWFKQKTALIGRKTAPQPAEVVMLPRTNAAGLHACAQLEVNGCAVTMDVPFDDTVSSSCPLAKSLERLIAEINSSKDQVCEAVDSQRRFWSALAVPDPTCR